MKNPLQFNLLFLPSMIFSLILLANFSTFAQSNTRSITSDDFASQRPKSKKNETSKSKKTPVTYKFVRLDKNIKRINQGRTNSGGNSNKIPNPTPQKPEKVSEIGLTMWKLRPARSADSGHKIPVSVNNLREMWTAERVNPNLPFRAGDRVRLAVESSDTGYLYVINSEMYADGSFGDPLLIFPASTDEDNSVLSGLLVDIPDQSEDLPYFLIEPKQANYTGELLTVIISPKPLTNIKIDKDRKIKNLDELIELEGDSDAEIFSRTDSQDKIYTQAEADSSCGSKTRQFVREKSTESPCGAKTRQLTREEPLPHTIYRVKTQAGQPAVAFIKLNTVN